MVQGVKILRPFSADPDVVLRIFVCHFSRGNATVTPEKLFCQGL